MVGKQAPEQPAQPVEKRTHGNEHRPVFGKNQWIERRVRQTPDILQQRGLKTDYRNARGDIEEENEPDEDELPGSEAAANESGMIGTNGFGRGWSAAGRREILRRVADKQAERNQNGGENDPQPHEYLWQILFGLHDQKRREQPAEKKGADAESHHDYTGRKPFLVREPLGRGRDRGDITETYAGTADHAITQVEKQQVVVFERNSGQQIAQRKQRAAREGQFSRPQPRQGHSRPGRGDAERENGDAECDRGVGIAPAKLAHEHGLEKAPCVYGAKAEL